MPVALPPLAVACVLALALRVVTGGTLPGAVIVAVGALVQAVSHAASPTGSEAALAALGFVVALALADLRSSGAVACAGAIAFAGFAAIDPTAPPLAITPAMLFVLAAGLIVLDGARGFGFALIGAALGVSVAIGGASPLPFYGLGMAFCTVRGKLALASAGILAAIAVLSFIGGSLK